jgi:hypothetical protein
MSGEIVNLMLTLRNQVKIYHWETMQFARHKSTDDLVGKLDDSIDKFVEIVYWKVRSPEADA